MDCKLRAKNCGGCPLLGLDYAEQLKQKEATVKKLLGKYGPVNAIRGMENPYHYRNKVISTFTTGWGGKLTSGIYAANSHKVLPVERCLLQDEVLDKTMEAVRAAAIACRYQPYNEDKGTGLVRHCLLRRGVATGQVMVVLVTAQILLGAARLRTVVVGQVEVGDAVVEGGEAELLHGLIAARVTKIVPEPQRDGGQQQAALAAAVVRHGGITCIGCLIHKKLLYCKKGLSHSSPV